MTPPNGALVIDPAMASLSIALGGAPATQTFTAKIHGASSDDDSADKGKLGVDGRPVKERAHKETKREEREKEKEDDDKQKDDTPPPSSGDGGGSSSGGN